jgi:hypothetical protein
VVTVAPFISQLTKDILFENLSEEVRLTLDDNNDFFLWKEANAGRVQLNASKRPALSVSFDMAWQQRSSGNRYNSASGHALLVGKHTRRPLALCIKSKFCNVCKAWSKKEDTANFLDVVPPHHCQKNHEGSSGSMEPASCLEMVVDLHENTHCDVVRICCDDDASTRSLLKWTNADHMKNNNSTEPPQVPISKGKNKGKLQLRPDRGRLPPNVL